MIYSAEFGTFVQCCVCSAALGFLTEGVEFGFLNHSVRVFYDIGSSCKCFVHYSVRSISCHSWDT